MSRNLANTCVRSMGVNCAQTSLCAYYEDTAYLAVSFFGFLRFSYYGNSMMQSERNRQSA